MWGNHGERDTERRKLLIGLGSLTAAGSAVIGTGAFTTAQSDRTVDVNVTAEESGSVGITGLNDTCASGTGDGELELDFDEDSGPGTFHGDAEDVNADSTSDFAEVFGIANTAGQGDARVIIEATGSGDLASLNPTVDGEKATAIDPGTPLRAADHSDVDNLPKLVQPDAVDVDIEMGTKPADQFTGDISGTLTIHFGTGGDRDELSDVLS